MVRIALGFYLFFLVLLTNGLLAQENDNNKIFSLNCNTILKGSFSEKILTSIALANGKDLKNTEVLIDYSLRSELLRVNGHIAEIKLTIGSISFKGDVIFRGFTIDNNLRPDFAQVEINVHSAGELVKSKIVEIPLDRETSIIIFELDTSISKSTTKVSVLAIGFYYSTESFKAFENYTKLINNYYGYSLLLSDLNEELRNHSMNSNVDVSTQFLKWHETARVYNLVNELQLVDWMDLKTYDPENFIKKGKELARHKRRSTTLLNKSLKAELKTGFSADKQKYIHGLVALSNKYFKKSKTLQPFLATAFFESILINSQAGEPEVIKSISEYYDSFAYGDQIIVPVALNNLFVENAREYLNASKNNMALQQLKNAQIIQEYFSLLKTEVYSSTLAITLNGMIESYLLVSNKAFRSGNFAMAENYYQNAEKVFNENIDLFRETNITATPFEIYLDTQQQLAEQLLAEGKYEDAERLILNCQRIIVEKGLEHSADEENLMQEARIGVFKNKIASAKRQLQKNNIDSATVFIYEAAVYRAKLDSTLNVNSFNEVSYSVFEEYLKKGEFLLEKGKHNQAKENLLKAKEIQIDILGFEVEKLNELLKNSSVPIIMDKIEEAGFYSWAKKTEDANRLLSEVKEMQQTYHQLENVEIKTAIKSLEDKMNNRHCLDIEFMIQENANTIVNEIGSGNFNKALQIKIQSNKLIESNSNCVLNISKLDSVLNYYNYIFVFYDDYQSMNRMFVSKKYLETIDFYLKLENTYSEYNINELDFRLPSFYEFVKEKEILEFTKTCVSYYIDKEQYEPAFEFIDLLKMQGLDINNADELDISRKDLLLYRLNTLK